MKLGIAQINTTVGDLEGNLDRVRTAYLELIETGAELVVFPEMVLSGYPPRDLLLRDRFMELCRQHVEAFARETGSVPAVLGFPEVFRIGTRLHRYNSVAFCHAGELKEVGRKCLLPTYDVFDEDRYFTPGMGSHVVEFNGLRIGLTVCEDFWYRLTGNHHHGQPDPLGPLEGAGLNLLINASASPWHRGKLATREELVCEAARRCNCPVVYVNAVGGNDELVFDGQSLVVDAVGTIRWRGAAFAEEVVAVEDNATIAEEPAGDLDQTYAALVLGVRDYAHKSGFSSAVVGLSGGIDSALTAAIATEAFGAENVLGVRLPSAISSDHSLADAEALARNLGIRLETLPIAGIVDAAETTLAAPFAGRDRDVTEENIQARARGLLLMALSNKFGHLLITTGNKSEIAVGYCTLYGDMAGGLAAISDVPKTLVFALARHLNRNREVIPESTLTKPPSAELRPDQKDEDSLPPYPVLDEILRRYVEENQSRDSIAAAGFDPGLVAEICAKVDRNEYKRKQAAPGIKITPLAFGIGRRIPIVQKFR